MVDDNSSRVGEYFEKTWDDYQAYIKNDTLYHSEMYALVDEILKQRAPQDFTLVDFGCGDGSAILPYLMNKPIKKYIGVDSSQALAQKGQKDYSDKGIANQFICKDMKKAFADLPSNIDIFFSSYAVHHLSYDAKVAWLKDCHEHLHDKGFVILIDGILRQGQTREEYLQELRNRLTLQNPEASAQMIDEHMEHPTQDDFPEQIATFENIAQKQKWKNFEVLVNKEIFAFMIFTK